MEKQGNQPFNQPDKLQKFKRWIRYATLQAQIAEATVLFKRKKNVGEILNIEGTEID